MSEAVCNNWLTLPLGQLAELRRGITYSSTMLESEEDGLPYVNMKSFLKGGGFNPDGTKSYTGTYAQNDLVGENDLLIANTDVTAGDIVGVPALLPEHLAAVKVLFSHHVTRLRINGDVTVPFLYYLLCLPEYRSHMLRIARGTTVLMLDMHAIKRIPVRAPKTVDQQRRIAEILSTLDEAIEQTEALIAKIQQVKAGLMHDLFTRGVTPDGRLRPTREQAPDLYKESPLGWIPKEWGAGRLDQYLDQQAGIKPGPFGSSLTKDSYVLSGFKVYGQEQVIAGSLEIGNYYISEMKFREMSTFEVLTDDVLISLVGTVGCVLVAKPPFERGIINPRLMRLRPARGVVFPDFLKNLLLSADVRRQLDVLAGGGTMPVINGKIVRRLIVPLLSYDEQVKVASLIDALEGVISVTNENMAKLRQQKHGLMHDLLTGRVRV